MRQTYSGKSQDFINRGYDELHINKKYLQRLSSQCKYITGMSHNV